MTMVGLALWRRAVAGIYQQPCWTSGFLMLTPVAFLCRRRHPNTWRGRCRQKQRQALGAFADPKDEPQYREFGPLGYREVRKGSSAHVFRCWGSCR